MKRAAALMLLLSWDLSLGGVALAADPPTGAETAKQAGERRMKSYSEKEAPESTPEEDAVDLLRAAKVGNGSNIRYLLKRGTDPNQIEPERGESALMLAVREDGMDAMRALLESDKTKIEHKAKNGDTALMLAAYKGNLEALKALLAKGAQPNQPGWTALHYAAIAGHTQAVALLLEHHAYIDCEAPNKNTPIMLAAYAGHIHTVKLLLDEGADLTLKNETGLTALDFARQAKHQDIVEGLTYQLKKRGKL